MYKLINEKGDVIEQSSSLGVILLEASFDIGESFHHKGFWIETVFRKRKIGFVHYEIKETDGTSKVKYTIVKEG